MYDPKVIDTFLARHGDGYALAVTAPAPAPAERHSALQAPLRTGEEQHELDLHTFFEFGRALGTPASMFELGEIVWAHFKGRVPATAFVLYAYDQADDSIVAVYDAFTDNCRVSTSRITLGERLSGWVAATGQVVVNSDARLDLDEAARDQSPLRSALAVPVMSDGRALAVLSFYAIEPNAFEDTHRRLLSAAGLTLAQTIADADHHRFTAAAPQDGTRVLRN
jgi:GAF domain-containing protein